MNLSKLKKMFSYIVSWCLRIDLCCFAENEAKNKNDDENEEDGENDEEDVSGESSSDDEKIMSNMRTTRPVIYSSDSERADSERADSERATSERADSERADSERADSDGNKRVLCFSHFIMFMVSVWTIIPVIFLCSSDSCNNKQIKFSLQDNSCENIGTKECLSLHHMSFFRTQKM